MSLSFILSLVMSVTVSLSCDSFIPPELLGCAFNSLLLVNPSSGFVIAEENCGLEVDKEVFFEQPYVFFTDAVSDVKYTMMMVDNDNPLSNDLYLHWLVTDIDGESLKFGLGIYSGNVIAGKNLSFSMKKNSRLTIAFSLCSTRSITRLVCSSILDLYLRAAVLSIGVSRTSRISS